MRSFSWALEPSSVLMPPTLRPLKGHTSAWPLSSCPSMHRYFLLQTWVSFTGTAQRSSVPVLKSRKEKETQPPEVRGCVDVLWAQVGNTGGAEAGRSPRSSSPVGTPLLSRQNGPTQKKLQAKAQGMATCNMQHTTCNKPHESSLLCWLCQMQMSPSAFIKLLLYAKCCDDMVDKVQNLTLGSSQPRSGPQ